MLSFLKKAGQILAAGVAEFIGIEPILRQLFPQQMAPVVALTAGGTSTAQTVMRDLVAIAQVVIQIEGIGATLGLSGADKLRAATVPVQQILMQSTALVTTDAGNRLKTAQDLINGMVAILNAIHPDIAQAATVPTSA